MRKLMMFLVLLSAVCSWAQGNAVMTNEKFGDSDFAEIQIVVKDVGEPVYEPLELKVLILCKDNRRSKTASVPKWTLA